jgi:chromosome segregation ATPase
VQVDDYRKAYAALEHAHLNVCREQEAAVQRADAAAQVVRQLQAALREANARCHVLEAENDRLRRRNGGVEVDAASLARWNSVHDPAVLREELRAIASSRASLETVLYEALDRLRRLEGAIRAQADPSEASPPEDLVVELQRYRELVAQTGLLRGSSF